MERNYFETLSQNKTEFLTRLALDENIAKCLINTKENFQDNVVSEDEKYGLIYTHIFPYMKTTGTLSQDGSYIAMKFKYSRVKGSNIFKTAYVTLFIFCSESAIKTSYQVLRTDYLLQQVDRLLNDTRNETWLGKLVLEDMSDTIMDNNGEYIGIAVTYKNTEFQ